MGEVYTPEDDRTILDCVAKSIAVNGNISSGIKTAADLLGKTFRSIENRFYKKLKDRVKKPPASGRSGVLPARSVYTPEDDALIFDLVEKRAVPAQAFREAAEKLGKTTEAVKSRYRRVRKIKAQEKKPKNVPEPAAKTTVQEAIAEMIEEKGFRHVEKEDLSEIAKKTGEHYHSVLSAWGSAWSNLKADKQQKNCPWCRAKEVTQLRAAGMTYAEIGKRFGINNATAVNFHKTYRLFPGHRSALPFYCYVAIAKAETAEPPEEWAAFAEENHLSVRELQNALQMPLQEAKKKFGRPERKGGTDETPQVPHEDFQEAQQKIASLYAAIYSLQQDVKGLNTLVNSLQEEKAALQEDLREQHAKAVSLLKNAHVREKALLSLLRAVAEEAGVPARWKRAADVFADDANRMVKAVRGIKRLNSVYLTMLKNKNAKKKAAKKGA